MKFVDEFLKMSHISQNKQKLINKIEFFREWVFIIGMVFILPFVYTKTTIDPVLSLRFCILSILLLVILFLEIFIFIRKGNSLIIQKSIKTLLKKRD